MSTESPAPAKNNSKQKFEGRRRTFFGVDPSYVLVIGVDTHHASMEEHILYQTPEELTEEWIENLAMKGVLEPVLVRKEMNGDAVVVAGRRRTLGLREANKRRVARGLEEFELPILGEGGDDDNESLERMIIENFARREPNPLQKSMLLKAWWERPENREKTDQEAANTFGVTATSIRNWKKMWDLAPKVQKAIMQGEISPNAASDLADLEPEEQVKKLSDAKQEAAKTGQRKVTTRHTETERQQRKGSVAAVAYTPPKATVLRKVAEDTSAMGGLPALVQSVLRYIVGLSDGADLPELKALVEETPGRGKRKKAEPKLSKAQQDVLDLIDEAKGELLASQASKKKSAVDGLIKLGLVERYESTQDGLFYLRRTNGKGAAASGDEGVDESSAAGAEASASGEASGDGQVDGGAEVDPASVEIPSIEDLEEMTVKEFNKLFKALKLPNTKLSGLKGTALANKKVSLIIEEKKRREKVAKAAAKQKKDESAATAEVAAKQNDATPIAEA